MIKAAEDGRVKKKNKERNVQSSILPSPLSLPTELHCRRHKFQSWRDVQIPDTPLSAMTAVMTNLTECFDISTITLHYSCHLL